MSPGIDDCYGRCVDVLAFFNNKGGVGKTTLACNYASFVAREVGRNTLVIDLDPQCNSTQLMLDETEWEEIYSDADRSVDASVMAPLRPIRLGDSSVDTTNLPIRNSSRFEVDVLPGHPALSVLEDILGESWGQFRGGNIGGARRTCWLRALSPSLSIDYDLVVLDLGPSLGALNRSALIGSTHFVTPMASDLFSLYALDNIAVWFRRWVKEYDQGFGATREELDLAGMPGSEVPEVLPIRSGFLGYTVQQYVTGTRHGGRRKIEAYETYRRQIPERAKGLIKMSPYSAEALDLGTVPNMFSMIPLAQSAHSPIGLMTKQDGIIGAQTSQQDRYLQQLRVIFASIEERLTAADNADQIDAGGS